MHVSTKTWCKEKFTISEIQIKFEKKEKECNLNTYIPQAPIN